MKIVETTLERFKSYFNEIGFISIEHCIRSYSFDFYKINNGVQHEVNLFYIKKGKGFTINGSINSFIICLNVVKILEQFIELNSFEKITVLKFPNYDKNFDDPSLRAIELLPVNTEEEFGKVRNIISQHINAYVLPFFDKVPSLQSVNDEILNKVPEDDYSNYIPGETNFKVLIIMKLCGNPKYESFKNWALDAYKRGTEVDEKKYGADYRTLQSLVLYLDSGQYKENQ